MRNYLRVSEAAEMLRVTPQTIRKYYNKGKLPGYTTPGGQIIYKREDIKKLLEPENHEENTLLAFYIRASDGDKNKMQEQEKQLTEKYGTPIKTYKDSASGLNENRKGLQKLLDDAKNGRVNTVRYTQKDRLTRFGYKYLIQLFEEYGCDAQAAFDKPDKTLQEELLQDFMSLIASFSGKYYRLRGYEQKRQLLSKAEEVLQERQDESEANHDESKA